MADSPSTSFRLGVVHPSDEGTSRYAAITTAEGATYDVNHHGVIKNPEGPKLARARSVFFVPHEEGEVTSSGPRTRADASEVYLLPCEAEGTPRNLGLEGLKEIGVVIILRAVSLGHIHNTRYIAAKLKFLALGTDRLADLMGLVIKKFNIRSVFNTRYSEVAYDQIGADVEDPLNIRHEGRYYADLGLPWLQIGKSRYSNPGLKLDRNKTLDENHVKQEGVIFCFAYQPGNHLISYEGAGQSDIEKFFEIIF